MVRTRAVGRRRPEQSDSAWNLRRRRFAENGCGAVPSASCPIQHGQGKRMAPTCGPEESASQGEGEKCTALLGHNWAGPIGPAVGRPGWLSAEEQKEKRIFLFIF